MVNQNATFYVRFFLWLLLVLLVLVLGLVYLFGMEGARNFPEFAHLQIPMFLAIAIGTIPMVMGVRLVFIFLRLVDDGEGFSEETGLLFQRLKTLLIITAGYLLVGLIGVWVAFSQLHPTILFGWLAVQVVTLFLLALATLLEGLFSKAFGLRQDVDLTI